MPLDPGLLRFSAAVRTSLSTIVSALLVIPTLLHMGQPLLECTPIVLFSALAGLFARDATVGKRQVTLALSFLSGALAFAVAATLAHWPLIGAAGILLLLGGLTLLQMRGPRIICIGLTAMVGYYLGLFIHPPLASQGVMLLLLLPTLALAALMMRLLPDDPGTVAHLMLASVAAQADRVVSEAMLPQRDAPRLERHLMQLNRAIIVAQAQLTLSELPGYVSTVGALINLEVAVTHAVLRVDEADTTGVTTQWRTTLNELAKAAAVMGRTPAPSDAALAAATSPHAPLAWRSALRATCAGVMATCVGYPLSPEHWYWAVISVFVISTGTFSAGDTIQKGMLRLVGTAGGALAGFCVAALVPAHPAVVMVGMALCLFGWSYFVLHNYALGIGFLTLLIGLTYGVLGQDLPEVAWVRLLETAIGAASTFVTAMWLVPLPMSHHIRARALTLIARLIDVIDVSRETLAAGQAGTAPLAAMRRADQAMQDLRVALLPLRTAGRLIALIPRADALPRVMICVHWVRVLAVAAASEPTLLPEDRSALLARLDRLRGYLAVVGVATVTRGHADAAVATSFGSVSASLIAEAADRIEAVLVSLFGRAGATPHEFAKAFLS
ncbi:MAG: fusaric acid resistance family protein [Tardiphaga sp.]|jgi:hypothetical protein|nr:fusaric acid resistance family protein [Tardiphaga sp.]